MLRTSLVGVTKTLSARMRESGGVVSATMYPTYVKADSGTMNYEELFNKPTINGVTLIGDLSFADLGLLEAQTSDIEAMFEEN